MTTALTLESAFDQCLPLVGVGAALHWLRPRGKAPRDDAWSTAPVHTADTLRADYRAGANIGIRLGAPSHTEIGYLHLIDLDIRDESKTDEARATLRKLWPGFEDAPTVVSGSGGSSRHFYFFTETPYRSRKLAKSPGSAMVFDKKLGREVKKNDWEIELFGTGKQAVLPPSIHPVTGKPYLWLQPLDADLIWLEVYEKLPTALVNSWGAAVDDRGDQTDDDDLDVLMAKSPLDLEKAEIDKIISELPESWVDDRDQWLIVGQALHHEHKGTNAGFERWCAWAIQSPKFSAKDSAIVWRSFKGAKAPVTMRSLIAEASRAKLRAEHDQVFGDDEEVEDLLGDEIEDLLAEEEPDILGPKPKATEMVGDWQSLLQITEEGEIKSVLHNIRLIVENDKRTKGVVCFNEFKQDVRQRFAPAKFKIRTESPKPIVQLDGNIWKISDEINGNIWFDSHDHQLRGMIEAPKRQGGYGIKVTDRDLGAAVDTVGRMNAWHPIRDYLMSLKWDGKPRVETLWIDYIGSEDTRYHRDTARLFMLGAVARVMEPGCKFDFVPILSGGQGLRKSTFVEALAKHKSWWQELEGDFHDRKTMVEKMNGSWIMELPEMSGVSRADTNSLKAFISATDDKIRMPYARRAEVFKRQTVFLGTVNGDQFLYDTTGNRRFWPITVNVTSIEIDRLRVNVDQLWAEAFHLYLDLRKAIGSTVPLPLYLADEHAAAEATVHQENRRTETISDILAGEIHVWLDTPLGSDCLGEDLDGPRKLAYRNMVCVKEIWCEMMGNEGRSLDQREATVIGNALRLLKGWTAKGPALTARYGKQRVWRRDLDNLPPEPVDDLLG